VTPIEADLLEVLVKAQSLRFLGPGDPADHLSHAMGFRDAVSKHLQSCDLGAEPDRFCDLGTGGGVPGLVLAAVWPGSHGALIESAARRCAALEGWARDLGIQDRVEVLHGRAEFWAHAEGYRETFQIVTARSFAKPAITAEIASGLVRIGGAVIVSDPPDSPPDRWPADGLGSLGLSAAVPLIERGVHFSCLDKIHRADPATPRSEGKPAKRPLW
jgi:16S rRNA (guanine527-N7)-methyltransferase